MKQTLWRARHKDKRLEAVWDQGPWDSLEDVDAEWLRERLQRGGLRGRTADRAWQCDCRGAASCRFCRIGG
jgi:hypothetical protein